MFPSPLRLALFAALCCGATAASNAANPDPRPALLVVGETSSLPAGNGASWAALLQKAQPDWNVVVFADAKRTAAESAAALPAFLAGQPPLAGAILFVGTHDAAAEPFAKGGAAGVVAAVGSMVDAVRKHPGGATTKLFVATPLPVIDARLDKWSIERFKGGEANSDAIAAALREAAPKTGATLIDIHAWAKEKAGDDGKPGMLLGTIGWTLRDWGHPILSRRFQEAFAGTAFEPADAAAFAAWKAELAAGARLAEILSATSEGLVAHGPALPSSEGAKGATAFAVPAPAIQGPALDVLFTSDDKMFAVVGQGGNMPAHRTILSVTTDTGKIDISLPAAAWQLLDESAPTRPTDASSYRFNAGKMNYFGVTSAENGARRWMLARFPLDAVAGRKVTQAVITVPGPAGVERFTPPDKVEPIPGGELGRPAAALITGPDRTWDDTLATWKSRDGKAGWTGGTVDKAARKMALEAFLKTNPPPGAAADAKAMLSGL
jgi:hypothetical protein